MKLPEYKNEIENIKSKILEQEKDVQKNPEQLGKDYKALGDEYSKYFLNLFVTKNETNCSLADLSFPNYEKASNLFLENNLYVEYIYSLMAWGNAYKELFLPSMKKKDFSPLYTKANEKYKEGIDFALNKSLLKEYHFLMLEQFNLEIRKRVWDSDYLLPKRVIFFIH